MKQYYVCQVDRLEQGGVNTIGKEYFTALYSPVREVAFTPKNIKAGFAISSLFPFNLNRVLRSIPTLLIKLAILRVNKVKVGF